MKRLKTSRKRYATMVATYSCDPFTGLLQRRSGAREYPVEYTYDYAGRLRTMKTWTNSATGAGTATTVWDYNACRGWLERKRYANVGQGYLGPDYSYTAGGRLRSCTWARARTGGQRLLLAGLKLKEHLPLPALSAA